MRSRDVVAECDVHAGEQDELLDGSEAPFVAEGVEEARADDVCVRGP
jgi:hypothetical protein